MPKASRSALTSLSSLARRDAAERRRAAAEQHDTGVAGQIPRLLQLEAPLRVEAVEIHLPSTSISAHPRPLGLHGELGAVFLGAQPDGRGLDPHRQILGDQGDVAALGGDVSATARIRESLSPSRKPAGRSRWIGVVQLDPDGAAEVVDRDRRIQPAMDDPQLVEVPQRRTGEVAELAVVPFGLQLGDHDHRKTTSCSAKRRSACGSLSRTEVSMT